jgi:hypothetical protein
MGRDGGCHADRDALGAVGQEVGEAGRQNFGLQRVAVVGRPEVDRVLVDAVEQRRRDLGQARLGVAHGRRVIAVDVAEVALAVDQRKAQREVLGQAHQGVVDRLVAVRMKLADHVADHPGRLLEALVRGQAQLAHGIEQAPVHRLEAVAHVGQRARHDGRQRIGEIALLERVDEAHVADLAGRRWGGGRGHGSFRIYQI